MATIYQPKDTSSAITGVNGIYIIRPEDLVEDTTITAVTSNPVYDLALSVGAHGHGSKKANTTGVITLTPMYASPLSKVLAALAEVDGFFNFSMTHLKNGGLTNVFIDCVITSPFKVTATYQGLKEGSAGEVSISFIQWTGPAVA